MRRLRRLLVRLLALGLVLAATGLLACLVLTRTAGGRAWILARIDRELAAALAGRVTIGGLEGDLLRRIVVRDLRWEIDGRRFLAVTRAEGRLDLLALVLGRGIVVPTLAVDGVAVRLEQDADGGWNVERLERAPEPAAPERPGPALRVGALTVRRGTVKVVRPADLWRVRGLALDGGLALAGTERTIELAALRATVRGIAVADGRGRVTLAPHAMRLAGVVLRTEGSTIGASGSVPLDGAGTWDLALIAPRLAGADVRALVGWDPPPDELAASLRLRGPVDDVTVAARARSATGRARVDGRADLGDLSAPVYELVAALAAVDPAALAGVPPLAGRPARLDGTVRLAGRGGASATADFDLTSGLGAAAGRASWEREGERFAFDAALRALDLGPLLGHRLRSTRLTGRVAAEGTGLAPARLAGRGTLTLEPSAIAVDGRSVDVQGRAAATVADGRLAIEELALASSLGELRATGALGLAAAGRGTLDVAVRVADLEPVAVLAGVAPVAGAAELAGTVAGSLASADVRATLVARGLRRDAVGAGALRAELDGRALGSADGGATVSARAEGVTIAGRTLATATLDGTWLARGTARAALAAAEPEGRRHRLAVTATLGAEEQRIALDALAVTLGDAVWSTVGTPVLTVRGRRISVADFEARSADGVVRLQGSVDRDGPVAVTASLAGLAWAPVLAAMAEPAASGPAVAGTLAADLRLDGTLRAPRGTVAWRIDDARVEHVRFASAGGTVVLDERGLGVTAEVAQVPAGTLTVEARLPVAIGLVPRRFEERGPLAGRIRAARLDLAALAPLVPAVRDPAGVLELDLALGGSLAAPELRGPVAVREGRVRVLATGLAYEGIALAARLDGTVAVVDELAVASGSGRLRGSGTTRLGAAGPEMDLRVELTRFPLLDVALGRAIASGWVWLTGDLATPSVEGALTTDELVIRVPEVLPASVAPPDPTITVVGAPPPPEPAPGDRRASEPAPPPPAFFDRTALTLQITVPGNAWVRRSDTNIELRGWLTAWKKPQGTPRLSGEIRAVRGWYAFQGRRFEIREATVTFTGAEDPTPLLDVAATYRAGAYVVTVRVGGTIDEPTLALESDPALSQSDILSVVLFGRPASQLDEGQATGLREQAIGVAGNYVATELRQSVADALGLDDLSFDSGSGVAGDAARVSAGKYVLDDVFVSLSHQFGDQTVDELRIQYSATPCISLESSMDTLGRSGVDVYWRHRY